MFSSNSRLDHFTERLIIDNKVHTINPVGKLRLTIFSPKIVVILVSLAVLISGCNDAARETNPDLPNSVDFSADIPPSLASYVSVGALFTSELRISGTIPINLFLDLENFKVQGNTGDIFIDTYVFELSYFIKKGSIKVMVAQSTTDVAIVVTPSAIDVKFPFITYFDDDNDGFTNLAELAAGTSWFDAAEIPVAENPRNSANYLLADKIVGNPTEEGSVIADMSQSANYSNDTIR